MVTISRNSRTVVVFGATGHLGTHIAIHLQSLGYKVVAVGRRTSDNGFFGSRGIPYYSVDISDKEGFQSLPTNDIFAVVHFAGALPASMKGYDGNVYISSIIQGTMNVLEYAIKVNANRIIFPQSLFDVSYLFGSKIPIPADSERIAPLSGDHAMYVIAKNAAVDMIQHYSMVYGLKHYILRLSRVYMYDPNPYTYTNGEKVLISDRYLIYQAIKGNPLEIWGDPNRLLETCCVKDFLQIVEKCIENTGQGGIYNIGSGGSTLEERIRSIAEVFNPKDKESIITYCPEKRNAQQFVLDISKTISELGYSPRYSWKEYLLDFKKEMEEQPFSQLWGKENDYYICR